MSKFKIYQDQLKNLSKFATEDNFDEKLSIIRATCNYCKHIMLVEEDFASLKTIYDQLEKLESADLFDYLNFEKELWKIQ